MIEIIVKTTSDEGENLVGIFNPQDVPAILLLMEKYGVLDAEGVSGKVDRIVYDVGFRPSIYVSIAYDR